MLNESDKYFFRKLESIFNVKRESDDRHLGFIKFSQEPHYPNRKEILHVLYHLQGSASPYVGVSPRDIPQNEKNAFPRA